MRANASIGACIVRARTPDSSGMAQVSTAPMATNRHTPAPTMRPPASASRSPTFWARKTVTPMAMLDTILVMVIIICDPVDTADTSSAPANLPTTSRSTAPYNACKNRASSTGSTNRSSGPRILPSVKL